jgi:uncharacterized protein (DUF486 family)
MDDFAQAAFRERRARTTLRRRAVLVHAAVYLAVNIFLILVWALNGAGTPWFLYVVGGWGIGLAAHAAAAYLLASPSDVVLDGEEQRSTGGTGTT